MSFYGVATVDGMNEKGLVANTLYLAESDYGKSVAGRPNMSIACWAQYVLAQARRAVFISQSHAAVMPRRESRRLMADILPGRSRELVENAGDLGQQRRVAEIPLGHFAAAA